MNHAPVRFTEAPQRQSIASVASTEPFGDWQQRDAMPSGSLDAEEAFRKVQSGVKISRQPFSGALPYATTPKEYRNPSFRLVPVSTKSSHIHTEFARKTEERGPLYAQQWPIWDNRQFRPSRGDVSLDPRYGTQTKGAATTYTLLE